MPLQEVEAQPGREAPARVRAALPYHRIAVHFRNTDIHLYSLAVSVGVLLAFCPFLVLTLSFFRDVVHWPAATDAVYLAIEKYFPGDLVDIIRRRLPSGGAVQLASLLFLGFAANAIFRPLQVALNRALGAAERRSAWRNQAVLLGLAATSSGLTMASLALTSIDAEWITAATGWRAVAHPWIALFLLKLLALEVSTLALFLVYWILPGHTTRRRAASIAISAALAVELFRYAILFAAPYLRLLFYRALGPFYDLVTILAWSFVPTFLMLAATDAENPAGAPYNPSYNRSFRPVVRFLVAAYVPLVLIAVVKQGHSPTGGAVVENRASPNAAVPSTVTFDPKVFYTSFSGEHPPALRVRPGDTVRTVTLDNGGFDAGGNRRWSAVNPQTGPFYVEGALPGDTLVVRLLSIRPNRSSAISGAQLIPEAVAAGGPLEGAADSPVYTEWALDRRHGFAMLANPTEHLKTFRVRLQPMLGCIAVAPPGGESEPTDSLGSWGGNLDYRELREGATVYLPVYHAGGLLFIGDAHAAQGDGELTDTGLETSMAVEFSVSVRAGESIRAPRAENREFLMAMGIGGSLPEALRQATGELAAWLERDYRITPDEAAVVLGSSLRYDVAEIANPQANIVARIDKSVVAALRD